MSSSPHQRGRVAKTARGAAKVRSLRLLIALVAAFALTAMVIAGFTRISAAQGGPTDSEDAFAEKADKVLKHVRQAVEESRVSAARGQLRREASEFERLSRTVGVQRNSNNQITVDVAVKLTEQSVHELEAAGFSVAARVGDMATLQAEVSRLPELASLSSVSKIFAAVNRYPLNDRARRNVGIDDALGQRVVSQTARFHSMVTLYPTWQR